MGPQVLAGSKAPALLCAALLATMLAVPPIHAQSAPALRIAELLPDPVTGQPEFIELWNPGTAPVDLAGWQVQDRLTTPSTYTFTTRTLGAGERIVVWTGTNATDTAEGPKWRTTTVWNNGGDGATILDPTGTVVDYVAYGSGGGTAPEGFGGSPVPAPTRGLSIALANGTWTEGAPTPGFAPGSSGASLSFTVTNVPPVATMEVPGAVRPGETFAATLGATDDNGVQDLASWSIRAGSELLATGTGAPPATTPLHAPATMGAWTVTLTVVDQAGAAANSSAATLVRAGGLTVTMPPSGSLKFPDLQPGAGNVVSLDSFVLRNQDIEPVTPRIDVSDFRGPTGTVAVAGNLWLGLEAGNTTTWVAYDGPLTAMPSLAPDQEVLVRFRLAAVPVPLAAGSYGTTFAVTA